MKKALNEIVSKFYIDKNREKKQFNYIKNSRK